MKKTTMLALLLGLGTAAPALAQTTAPIYWSCNYTPAPHQTSCTWSLNTGAAYPSGPLVPLGYVRRQGGPGEQPLYWACGFSGAPYQTTCSYAPRVGAAHASGITNVYGAPPLGYVSEAGGLGLQPLYWVCRFIPAPYVTSCTYAATVTIPPYTSSSTLLGYVRTTP